MPYDCGAERLSKAVLAESSPCDGCYNACWCKKKMACERYAYYCGFLSTGEDKTLDDCSKVPSRALYYRIYPPSGEYLPGEEIML